jgi:hypothetical protein
MLESIRKSFSLIRICNTIAFILMSYQILEFLFNYLKFETVLDIRIAKNKQEIPSLLICVNSLSERFIRKLNRQKKQILPQLIIPSIICDFRIYKNNLMQKVDCEENQNLSQAKHHFLPHV